MSDQTNTTTPPQPSQFGSVDPAPAHDMNKIIQQTESLCDEDERMFLRMRALFTLRNIGGPEAIDGLVLGFSSNSALLKHEIAYVLGQMQNSHAVPALIDRLSDEDEDDIVRHEAAEALGAIGAQSAMPILTEFLEDESVVVSESCEVAIDLLKWVRNDQLEYE